MSFEALKSFDTFYTIIMNFYLIIKLFTTRAEPGGPPSALLFTKSIKSWQFLL